MSRLDLPSVLRWRSCARRGGRVNFSHETLNAVGNLLWAEHAYRAKRTEDNRRWCISTWLKCYRTGVSVEELRFLLKATRA